MNLQTDESDLISAAKSGDEAALERLLIIHGTTLANHIERALPKAIRGVVHSDDILQETFLRAFLKIATCEATSATSFLAWLKSIANNQTTNTVKALQRKKRGGGFRRVATQNDDSSSMVDFVQLLFAHGNTPSQSVSIREATRALQVAISALPADQRQAIQLHYLDGMSVAEAAEAMNRTPGSLRGLLRRGKQNLLDAVGRISQWLSTG